MVTIRLRFEREINVSVQRGDLVYFSNPTPVGTARSWPDNGGGTRTPHLRSDQADIILIGPVVEIRYRRLQRNTGEQFIFTDIFANMEQNLFNQYFAQLVPQSFIMFSKDNKANLSSILGYYASITFKNDSTDKAELFNVGTDVFESSK